LSDSMDFGLSFTTAIEEGIDFAKLRGHLRLGLDRLLGHRKFNPESHIWMSGSGDSLFAAQAVLPGLQRWAGLKGTAISGMEFSRYRVPLLEENDSLWAISNSGSAARTRETVALAKSRGALAVGITGSESGALAAVADTYIYRPVEDLPSINEVSRGIFMNMNEFLVTMYSLYYVGLHIGIAKKSTSQSKVDEILCDCEIAIKSVGKMAANLEPSAKALAAQLVGIENVWIIGAGPSHGTARYCAAKFHEQLPLNGIPEDLEEWAHLQYFLTLSWKSRSVVVVLAPAGNSLDRAEELVHGIHDAGGRAIVVCDKTHGDFPEATSEFRLSADSEFLSPFTYHIPVQLLILHLARQNGCEPYALRRHDTYKLIRHGVVLEDSMKLS